MPTQTKPHRMTVAEFLDWASAQPRGRYELVHGEVVQMAPERELHSVIKGEVYAALRDAIKRAGLPCRAYGDGMTVVINDHLAREPDASVQCGVPYKRRNMILQAPLIVVEVVSPSSERVDTVEKVDEYFSVTSIQHYLIVDPTAKMVTHHERSEGGAIEKRDLLGGDIIELKPPGMKVPVSELLPEIEWDM
ncbi:MAG TPA: Uma2 family endonuclease [Hyphomicrobiaceae bacterium]|nr:Uma2 family endonuclease [Hyphomicrobiaceae bacterium]